MHQQYFPGQTSSSSYTTSFASPQYSQIMPPQGPGIVIANPIMASAQGAPGSKQNATGQKRKQVKNACVNCQKACKKCDEGRPCQRCVKYGLVETCQDSTRKERKKGIKRGPYKRRQPNSQSGSASASPSNVPLGNPMGATPQTAYSPMSGSPNMRAPMPFAYTPQSMNQFNQGYDTLNHPYGYPANYPKEHLIPGQFMFTNGNPVLSYNPTIVGQQEILSRSASPSPPLTTYVPNKTNTPMSHRSQSHTPVLTSSPANATSPSPNDNEEEEGSKLAILSQLCSTVLDNNDAPKVEDGDHGHSNVSSAPSDQQQRGAQNPQEHPQLSGLKRHSHIGLSTQTPPPSPHYAHSRTPSYDHDSSHQHNQSQGYHSGHNSPHSQQSHYTMNGHLSAPNRQGIHNNYTTPNSSPSASPTDASFSMPTHDSLKNTHVSASSQPHSNQPSAGSPQQGFWPLPSLQSVVNTDHYNYGGSHYQSSGNSHAQPQSGQNEWGSIHVGGGWQ